jgi:adenylate kinase family enzyme
MCESGYTMKGDKVKLECSAVLLLGPTGSGKTPLGQELEKVGINGHRAAHFDFGEQIRSAVARPKHYPLLTHDDVMLLRRKLQENALLEDDEFYLAERILGSFATGKNLATGDYIILNGLPRHTGQAQAMASLVRIVKVIYLDCSADVVRQRIATNAGGDRSSRSDDSLPEVERKLQIFRERTVPLVEYYRDRGIPVRHIAVTADMAPAEVNYHHQSVIIKNSAESTGYCSLKE